MLNQSRRRKISNIPYVKETRFAIILEVDGDKDRDPVFKTGIYCIVISWDLS